MAEEVSTGVPGKKEPEVLSDSSLVLLARNVGQEKLNGLVFAMMLNIPTTTIVNCIYGTLAEGLQDASDKQRAAVAEKCLLRWKELTADVKTKGRVHDLERALREIGKNDIADMVIERHQQNQELTVDAFNQL